MPGLHKSVTKIFEAVETEHSSHRFFVHILSVSISETSVHFWSISRDLLFCNSFRIAYITLTKLKSSS